MASTSAASTMAPDPPIDPPENGAPETAVRRESSMRRSSRLALASKCDGNSPSDEDDDGRSDDSRSSCANDAQQDAKNMSFDAEYGDTQIHIQLSEDEYGDTLDKDQDGVDDEGLYEDDHFDTTELDKGGMEKLYRNPYLKDLIDKSSTKLLHEANIRKEYDRSGEAGLFHLFLNKTLFSKLLAWLNVELKKQAKEEICMEKLLAYVGLELAMSLISFSEIADYWASSDYYTRSKT